jgi:CobQ/CobB/MinD/ParA nucleotide binding domain
LYDEGIKKTLVLLKPTSTGTKSTVAADALRFLFFFSRLFSPDHITSYACAKALNVQGFVFELHAGVPCYSTTQSLKNTFSSPPVCRILLRLSDSLITHLLSTWKGRNMQVIAVLNQKGGSGKTTIATHLARALQLAGHDVLLVDSDPQGSARDWAAVREDQPVPVVGLDRPTINRDLKSTDFSVSWFQQVWALISRWYPMKVLYSQ